MSGGNPEPRLFRQLKCTAIQSFLQPKLPIKTLPLYIKRWDTLTLVFMRVCVARLVVLTTKRTGETSIFLTNFIEFSKRKCYNINGQGFSLPCVQAGKRKALRQRQSFPDVTKGMIECIKHLWMKGTKQEGLTVRQISFQTKKQCPLTVQLVP